MNKKDIERMISLADDRYVDEMFRDRISGGRKNIALRFAAAAAALAVVVGGISYFVSTADKNRDITIDVPAVSMDDTALVSEAVPAERSVDYNELFKNKVNGKYPLYFTIHADSEFENESTSAFEMDYAVSILPFKAEGYWDKRSQFYVYLDKNGEPFGATVYLESEFDEAASPKFRCINVNIGKDGKLSHDFPVEDTVPANRFGADVYCFDDTAAYLSEVYQSNLKAYFAVGDMEYVVETCNISAAETGEIIDSIIKSGFSVNNFDMSAGYGFEHEATTINFDTANATEPFAGYVPVVDRVLYLYQNGVIYDVQKVNGNVTGQYMSVVYTDQTDDGERVMLEYYTKGYSGKEAFEKVVGLAEVGRESLDGFTENGEYKFTLNCDKFMINVTAKCPADKLWAYVSAIKKNSGLYNGMTLAEANTIAPFAGYVPQNETVGDMKLGTVQYNGRNIVLDYSGENRFSYIGLTYTEDKEMTADYSVITLEELINSDIVILRDDSEDNRRNYKFAVECNGLYGSFYVCIDSEKCTTAELYGCVLDTLMENATTDLGVQTGVHLSNGITLADSTLAKANKIPPFAGYVPQSESFGSLKLSAVSEGYFDGDVSPCLIHMVYVDDVDNPKQMLTSHFFSDHRAVSLEEIKVSAVPISELSADKLNDYKVASGTSILIDCGDFKILIGANANCSKEDIWRFINGVKVLTTYDAENKGDALYERLLRGGGEALTIEKVKELAQKGDALTWSDFTDFSGTSVGSGLFIMAYDVDGTDYTILVGGAIVDVKPMYIYLEDKDNNSIDIRRDSVEEFLGEKVPLNAAERENANLLTLDKVKELAKKGEDLTWSDFEEFSGNDVGSGLYIMVYPIEGTDYRVTIGGGSPDEKPMYIHFGKGDGNYIDLRTDSLDDYLNDKPFINYKF